MDSTVANAPKSSKSLDELRALLASYEERLSRSSTRTPEGHAALLHVPEPVLLLNDLAIDLRASMLESYPAVEAPTVLDCHQPEEPEPFSFVYKVARGVFRVHPRKGTPTAAILGPFAGPAPRGLMATAQTAHAAAPPVRYHISLWPGDVDFGAARDRIGDGQSVRFLTVPPRHKGYLISTDFPQPGISGAATDSWALLLATVGDPPEEISNAWAEFSDIVLMFSADSGVEVRRLS